MQASDDPDRLAELLERLLSDPSFRSEFRRDPSAASEAFGLPGLADDLAGGEKALHTLELRESRSSLAGVAMAAAAEGIGIFELVRYVQGQGGLVGPAARAVEQVVSRHNLEAVPAPPPHAPVVHAADVAAAPPPPAPAPYDPPPAPPTPVSYTHLTLPTTERV